MHCIGMPNLTGSEWISIPQVHVEKGHKHGSKVVLRGEAGCNELNVQPGDVIVVLEQKEHEVFKRIGADLITTRHISLREALCGVSFTIKALDDRVMLIQNTPGEVIKPDSWKCIQVTPGTQ